MARETFDLRASRTRRLSLVNASFSARYRVRAPTTPPRPFNGTERADCRLVVLEASPVNADSSAGSLLTTHLSLRATHPDEPSPSGIFKDEKRRKASPLTYSGTRRPFLIT